MNLEITFAEKNSPRLLYLKNSESLSTIELYQLKKDCDETLKQIVLDINLMLCPPRSLKLRYHFLDEVDILNELFNERDTPRSGFDLDIFKDAIDLSKGYDKEQITSKLSQNIQKNYKHTKWWSDAELYQR